MIRHAAWSKSRMKHKEPIMGSLHTPYRETGMRGFEPLPVVGFLFPITIIGLKTIFKKWQFFQTSKP